MVIKKTQFLPHLRNREFYEVLPKENEARILVNILGNYYSNNWQKCFWACVGCCEVYKCCSLYLQNLSRVNISFPRGFNMAV